MMDLVFLNATIIDGTSSPRYKASVHIKVNRETSTISRISPSFTRSEISDFQSSGARIIDCRDHILSPGFIDMHAHSDLSLLHTPDHEAKISQGCTTEVIGQDGIGYAPVDDECLENIRKQIAGWNGNPQEEGFFNWRSTLSYLDRLDSSRIATNAAYLVPQGNLRMLVVGSEDRVATVSEIESMKKLLVESLEQGAVGMSSGLTYVPGMYASNSELGELLKVVARYDGYYSPHTRSYGKGAMTAYKEMIDLAKETGVKLHLTHCTLNFEENKGKAKELLDLIDESILEGVRISLDSYPYLPGSTTLSALLPSAKSNGGVDSILKRLKDEKELKEIKRFIEEIGSDGCHGCTVDYETIEISGTLNPNLSEVYVGKNLKQLGEELEKEPFQVFIQLLLADQLGTTILQHVGHEENVRAIMRHETHCGGTDGILVSNRPHPRAWGTFPRYLGYYARDLPRESPQETVFKGGLEEVIQHLTSRSANVIGLKDRGVIKEGYRADLVLFDSETIESLSSFQNPKQAAKGIRFVVVNGRIALDEGVMTGERGGKTLRLTRDGEGTNNTDSGRWCVC